MNTATRTVMTQGVVTPEGTWSSTAQEVCARIDKAVSDAMKMMYAEYSSSVTIKQVAITPLNLGGMIFLAVTTVAEWEDG